MLNQDDQARAVCRPGQRAAPAGKDTTCQCAHVQACNGDVCWRWMLDGLGDGAWDWHIQSGRVSCSAEWLTALGYAPGDIGETLDDWIQRLHPADIGRVQAALDRHFAGETPFYRSEHRIQCRAGGYRWVADRGKVISRAPDGQPLRMIGIHTDITARIQVEQALADERDLLRAVIDNMGQGLTLTSADRRFEFVNPAYARLFGYRPEDLIGRSPRELTADEDRAALDQAHASRAAGRSSQYESRLVRADGTLAPVLITAVPRWKDGKIAGAIAVITDLTELKRAEQALRDSEEKFRAQLQAQYDQLRELHAQLQEQAIRDPLTQLYNRRYFNETLPREVARSARQGESLCLLMIDIDHFKRINDTYGHAAGDETLQAVAGLLLKAVRASDVVCRYGGEEILCLLPGTSWDIGLRRAEQIRAAIADLVILPSHLEARITASIGVAVLPAAGVDPSTALDRVDRALYQAKSDGRNCVRGAMPPAG